MAMYRKLRKQLRRWIVFIPLLSLCVMFFLSIHMSAIKQVTTKKTDVSSRLTPQPPGLNLDLLEVVNILGTGPSDHLPSFAWNPNTLEVSGFLEELRARRRQFVMSSNVGRRQRRRVTSSKTVRIATAACGERTEEGVVMLKSALLFGQHTDIFAYVFTDPKSVARLALHLLELKWTSDVLGNNFDFTIVRKTFPKKWNGNFYKPCATQRLFLPSALPEVDAVLYVDTDILFLSNLSQIWEIFDDMNATALAASAPNSEGPSNERNYITPEIPIYGSRGINAGVMLMNLTRMRNFRMEERAIAVEMLYKEKLWLADQDIYNIVFRISPDKLHVIDCSYNFWYTHCLSDELCAPLNVCFCDSTMKTGIRIIHGCFETFHMNGQIRCSGFMSLLYKTFQAMNLLTQDPLTVIEQLANSFRTLDRPCSNLTAETLYMNAVQYLQADRSTM